MWGCRFKGSGVGGGIVAVVCARVCAHLFVCVCVCCSQCSSDLVKQSQLSPAANVPLLAHKATAPLTGGRQHETKQCWWFEQSNTTHTHKNHNKNQSGCETNRLSAKNIARLAVFISFATLEELLLVTLVTARRSIVGHCVAINQTLSSLIHSRCMPAEVCKCVCCLFCDDIISALWHYLTSLIIQPPPSSSSL